MHASASTSSVAAASSSAFPAPILPAANLPPTEPFEYGEAVFHRRRAAWLAEASDSPSSSRTAGGGDSGPKRSAPAPRSSSSSGPDASLRRLEELLALCEQGAGDDIPSGLWKAGLENVHRGLIGGRKLARPMPLALTIKVLRAGWLRDGTWPKNLPPVADSPPFTPSAGPPLKAFSSLDDRDPLAGAALHPHDSLGGAEERAAAARLKPSRPERLVEAGLADGEQSALVAEGSGSVSDTEGMTGQRA